MAKVKRTKHYSIVKGIQRGADGELEDVEVVVSGACRTEEKAMARAKKINKNFLPMSAEYHAQETAMDERDFFEHCEFGEDVVTEYPSTSDIVVEDDVIAEE